MKMKDMREFSTEQLKASAAEAQRDLRSVREAVRIGKEKNTGRIRALRREQAQRLTVLQEREGQI